MNGFNIPELIVESLIRDGLQNVKDKPEIIDDLFSQLTRNYNNRKYGQAEIAKIKALVQKDIAVIFSYNQTDSKVPAFSIMVGSDTENKPRAHLSDDYLSESVALTTQEANALKKVTNIDVTDYDEVTGKLSFDDATDLEPVSKFNIFVDASGTEFAIVGGISNVPGDKSIYIEKGIETIDNSTPNCYIKSSIDHKEYEIRGVTSEIALVLGAHSKDALTTKYLYTLLKYFILSRKHDAIKRGMYLSTYSGSDFHNDSQFVGDQVYVRFLTISAKVDDTWRADQVTLIDDVEVTTTPVE